MEVARYLGDGGRNGNGLRQSGTGRRRHTAASCSDQASCDKNTYLAGGGTKTMWPIFKNLFSRSQSLNALLGDVIFVTQREHGSNSHSFFEWRVKKSIDETSIFVSLAMRPDGYAGSEGSPTNYINFDLATATRVRDKLNECIEFVRNSSKPSSA
jgi:hypothetical protein